MAQFQQPSTKPCYAFTRSLPKENISKFTEDLQKCLVDAVPARQSVFRRVAVLGLTWEDDDMGLKPWEYQQELFHVLRHQYNYDIEEFIIPATHSATRDVDLRVRDFVQKWEADDTLLMFVYSGHSHVEKNGYHFWCYGALNACRAGPRVDWNEIQGLANDVKGRTLHIFDSRYAVSGGVHDWSEILVASGWPTKASSSAPPTKEKEKASRPWSLVKTLTEKFRTLNGEPRTISQLYLELLHEAQKRGAEEPEYPAHFTKPNAPSIVIGKVSAQHRETTASTVSTPCTPSSYRRRLSSGPGSKDRVLITVTLRSTFQQRDFSAWKEWLATNSSGSTDISLEGVYGGPTEETILLVALPWHMWDTLSQTDEAYAFVGFIDTECRLARLEAMASRSGRSAIKTGTTVTTAERG